MKLFPHQVEGARWLSARRRGLLCDEQGVGKTFQVVCAADLAQLVRILWICPAGVRTHICREMVRGQTMLRTVGLIETLDTDVVVVSYEAAVKYCDVLGKRPFDLIVLDECHYLKSPAAKRTKAILGQMGIIARVRSHCRDVRCWALSGTPMPNTPDELWTILRAIVPETIKQLDGRPMSYSAFVDHYCRTAETQWGTKVIGGKNLGELGERIRPAMLRRRKVDVLKDLPPMVWGMLALGEAADTQKLIEALPQYQALVEAIRGVSDPVAALLEEFDRSVLASLVRWTGILKAALVAPVLVDELTGTEHKLIVGFWHRDVGAYLHTQLARFGAVKVDGSLTPAMRAHAIDEFQDGTPRVFLGQLRAAGTGISLTRADQVVLVEQSWAPSDNAQFAARPHRIGQAGSVLVRTCFLAGSIDEAIAGTLMRKAIDIALLIDQPTAVGAA